METHTEKVNGLGGCASITMVYKWAGFPKTRGSIFETIHMNDV